MQSFNCATYAIAVFSIYAWPVDIACKYHVTGLQPLAIEPSLLQARWSGTH